MMKLPLILQRGVIADDHFFQERLAENALGLVKDHPLEQAEARIGQVGHLRASHRNRA